MRSATEPQAKLVPLGRAPMPAPLPVWCDRFLAPPGDPDIFASRFWYDCMLAHALPAGAEPVLALCGPDEGLLVPLLRQGGRWGALVTPYSLEWHPLVAPEQGAAQRAAAGRGLARLLRGQPPMRLDTLDAEATGLSDMLEGLRSAGIAIGRYGHFGNWHQRLAPGGGWEDYLAARPPALRNTIRRKLRRAEERFGFELVRGPGPALEAAIAAYTTVRERSWKPSEPFPDFDAALLRAAAPRGLMRIGLLRRADGEPVAAQYWLLSGGRAALLKLAHDEAARADSPGTVLTALMIRHLIEVDAAAELDFGRGDDAYKTLWAAERRQRIGLTLSDRWHPAGFVEWARHCVSQARLAGGMGR
jgi:hypothetical protein